MTNSLKLAIFDLGQVCFRTHLERCFVEWEDMAGIRPGSVSRNYPFDEQYDEYERGQMTGRSYADYFCEINELVLDFEQWQTGWNLMFGEVIEPTLETIKLMRESGVKVVAMTNTNATHAEHWREVYKELVEEFDETYLSNEIGMRKPESRFYEYILEKHDCEPAQAVYFDDKQENVSAADKLGIESILFDDDSKAKLWWKRRQDSDSA